MTPAEMAAIHALAFADERPWRAEEIATLLAQDNVYALHDAQAFALVRQVLDETELLTVATHPAHRRAGRARALCTEWLRCACASGVTRAFLDVASDNRPARALYAELGFVEAGRRKAYYRRISAPPADAVTMICDLTMRQASDSGVSRQESG